MLVDSIYAIQPGAKARGRSHASSQDVSVFGDVLEHVLQDSGRVHFSNHARKRLDERRIVFSDRDMVRIAKSTDDAKAKGSKAALLLMDRLALVVGVQSRTVITVMEALEGENMVFTHIDSVVVVAKDAPLPL